MAFTASVTEFGHTFAEAVVEVTEANLEYRLNDYGAPADPGGGGSDFVDGYASSERERLLLLHTPIKLTQLYYNQRNNLIFFSSI